MASRLDICHFFGRRGLLTIESNELAKASRLFPTLPIADGRHRPDWVGRRLSVGWSSWRHWSIHAPFLFSCVGNAWSVRWQYAIKRPGKVDCKMVSLPDDPHFFRPDLANVPVFMSANNDGIVVITV